MDLPQLIKNIQTYVKLKIGISWFSQPVEKILKAETAKSHLDKNKLFIRKNIYNPANATNLLSHTLKK